MFIYRLFMGGHWYINIEAIWLIADAQQFDSVTKAITYFDGMLVGADLEPVTVDS